MVATEHRMYASYHHSSRSLLVGDQNRITSRRRRELLSSYRPHSHLSHRGAGSWQASCTGSAVVFKHRQVRGRKGVASGTSSSGSSLPVKSSSLTGVGGWDRNYYLIEAVSKTSYQIGLSQNGDGIRYCFLSYRLLIIFH